MADIFGRSTLGHDLVTFLLNKYLCMTVYSIIAVFISWTHKFTVVELLATKNYYLPIKMNLSFLKAVAAVVLRASVLQAQDVPTWPPMTQPSSPCADNTPDWVDLSGDGCDWYERMDVPGCPRYGDLFEGNMGTANDNCCFCAGTGVSGTTRGCCIQYDRFLLT